MIGFPGPILCGIAPLREIKSGLLRYFFSRNSRWPAACSVAGFLAKLRRM